MPAYQAADTTSICPYAVAAEPRVHLKSAASSWAIIIRTTARWEKQGDGDGGLGRGAGLSDYSRAMPKSRLCTIDGWCARRANLLVTARIARVLRLTNIEECLNPPVVWETAGVVYAPPFKSRR